ncbi:hypothetical protein MCAP1_000172 [Malassezia caprae]|uniref:HotDog ACOT-type domain-containing protein n=1 Tax=Malassezia caprae TaxID=1381934 RepID=A0AAF0ITQ5_9BASI|nr:hypothetical protein MCAP1_000172 [Malassezia caprae]
MSDKGSERLQTVDSAVQQVMQVLEMVTNDPGRWNTLTMAGSQYSLTHAERDGIVWGKDPRADTEQPARARQSTMRFRLQVQSHMANPFGTMHGGCIASVIDLLSSFVLSLYSPGEQGSSWFLTGVSQSLTVHYLAPTQIGTWIEVDAQALSVSRNVALVQTDVYELTSRDGERVRKTATSTHTKVDVQTVKSKL